MINAATSFPSENPQPDAPVEQAIKNNFQPNITSSSLAPDPTPKTDVVSDNPPLKFNTTPPGSKPKNKSKMSMKMIIGGILLVLLVVGSGVGLYLSQQTQDIRQDASLGPGTDPGGGSTPTTTTGETCNYDCSTGHPETPILTGTNCGTTKAMDVCRGKGYTGSPDGKYFNCQLCKLSDAARNSLSESEKTKRQAQGWYACPGEETNADASGCDFSCLCGNADQTTCYEKGPGHDAGVFNGNYNCKNTQVDVVLNGAHKWNCTSSDDKDWSQCAPPPPPVAPSSCQAATLSPSGTITDQTVSYTVTNTAGSTNAEFCFHSKDAVVTGADAWNKGWHCLQPTKSASNENLYTGTFKYADIRNAIIAINPAYGANIDTNGYRYATRTYTSENVYCTGGGVWSDGGTHHGSTTCTYNSACTGFVTPAVKLAGPSCKSLAVTGGTVTAGVRKVSTGTTKLTFDLTGEFAGGTIAGDQICFYPNYLGNKNDWSLGWYCLPSGSSVSPDPYHVEKTYNEIKAGIRSRDPQSLKITDAQIDSDGFRYAGNVHAPQGTFCDGGSKWQGVGDNLYEACTFNSACAGNVKLVVTAKPAGPSCKSLAVTGGTLNSSTGFREVPTATTKLTFNLTADSGSTSSPGIARNQICFYLSSTTGGDLYALSWYCVSPTNITTNPYQVELTYQQIKDGIMSKDNKATSAKIDSEGFRFAGIVHKPDGVFCDPVNVWMGNGTSLYQACDYKAGCKGKVKLVTVDVVSCNSDCTTGEAGDEKCAAALGTAYSCVSNKCRLTENPTSTTCAPLTPIACNGACTPGAIGDAQCQKTNPDYYCAVQGENLGAGKCRHKTYPDQLNCKKPDPVCLGITMTPTAPKLNESVTFTCSMVNGIDNYGFRIFEPGESTAESLSTATKNVSVPYTITKPGSFRAECRICPLGTGGAPNCLAWPQ